MRKPIDPTVGHRLRRPELTRDVRRLLVVVAHPDDESFGLGALVDRFTACGIDVSVLCFTHGEASTLGGQAGDLASVRAARASGLPMLAWVIPERVANLLNERHHTSFVGQPHARVDARLSVSRVRQRLAIAAHASQSTGNAVLQHRLRLLGDSEYLRLLSAPPVSDLPDREDAGSSPLP